MDVVIITGGSGGIGLAIRHELERQGKRVISIDNVASSEIDSIVFDLSKLSRGNPFKDELLKKINALLGSDKLVGLVNNAAVQIVKDFDRFTADELASIFEVNLFAPYHMSAMCMPALRRNQGTIVNVGSVHSKLSKPMFVPYAVSKAALEDSLGRLQ